MTKSPDYPRSLYLRGWADLSAEIVVHSAEEEEARRAEGYKKLTEFPHPDDAPIETAPPASAAEKLPDAVVTSALTTPAKPKAAKAPAKPKAA